MADIDKFNYGGTTYNLLAKTLTSARTIDGVSFDGSAAIAHYGTASVDSSGVATVSCTGFDLVDGAVITVRFTSNACTSDAKLQLKVNGKAGKQVKTHQNSAGTMPANASVFNDDCVRSFVYDSSDGGYFWVMGDIHTNSGGVTSITNGAGIAPIGGSPTDPIISVNLKTSTKATYDCNSVTNTQSRQYAVTPDKSGYLAVNVPWENSTYTASNGLSLDGTTFKHANTAITAQTTQKVYSVKIDSYGHITSATAVTIPAAANYAIWPAVRNVESTGYADAYSNITDSGINVFAGDNVEMTTVSTWNTIYINAASGFPLSSVSTGTSKYLREDGTWATPAGGSGTVTSVAISAGSNITVSGSPITSTGTITVSASDEKVMQMTNTSNTAYPIALAQTGNSTTWTTGVLFRNYSLTFNPSTKVLTTNGAINGFKISSTTTGTSKYLREDGSFATPAAKLNFDTNSYKTDTGNATAAGNTAHLCSSFTLTASQIPCLFFAGCLWSSTTANTQRYGRRRLWLASSSGGGAINRALYIAMGPPNHNAVGTYTPANGNIGGFLSEAGTYYLYTEFVGSTSSNATTSMYYAWQYQYMTLG